MEADNPSLQVYNNAFTFGRELIDACEAVGAWEPSRGYLTIECDGPGFPPGDQRKSQQHWFKGSDALDGLHEKVRSVIWRYVVVGEEVDCHGAPMFMTPRVHKYQRGDFFKYHSDWSQMQDAVKVRSCLFFLNTVDEGGELMFKCDGKKIRPVGNTLLTYDPTFVHQSLPVISGTKYICVSWVCRMYTPDEWQQRQNMTTVVQSAQDEPCKDC